MLSDRGISLLVVDLQLTGISGDRFARIARESFPDTPIVMTGDRYEWHRASKVFCELAEVYLSKPFGLDDLSGAILSATTLRTACQMPTDAPTEARSARSLRLPPGFSTLGIANSRPLHLLRRDSR